MEFKKITVNDIPLMAPYLKDENEFTCETTVANLAMWQALYNNQYCIEDGILFLKSAFEGGDIFNLPYGDMQKGMALLREYSGKEFPDIWAQEGARFEQFCAIYGQYYSFFESRNEFDYIYKTEKLSTLAGKKYHSKRNHISSFSKQHNWHYSPITKENIQDVKCCAAAWYAENSDKSDIEFEGERNGINILLDNMDAFFCKGGAIYVDNRVVAFTVGSPINSKVFDIHIEKALKDYATAYTVINREFAKNELYDYEYINRENDLGLDGLRRAKLSYHPDILLKKYACSKKEDV